MVSREQKQVEARLRGILESQQNLIVRVDLQNRLQYVNEAYCKAFGKTRDQLLGKSFEPLVHEEDLPKTLEAMDNLTRPPYRVYVEQRAMTVHGWRWIAWEDSAVLGEQGEIKEIQGVGWDITTQKQALEQLQQVQT